MRSRRHSSHTVQRRERTYSLSRRRLEARQRRITQYASLYSYASIAPITRTTLKPAYRCFAVAKLTDVGRRSKAPSKSASARSRVGSVHAVCSNSRRSRWERMKKTHSIRHDRTRDQRQRQMRTCGHGNGPPYFRAVTARPWLERAREPGERPTAAVTRVRG